MGGTTRGVVTGDADAPLRCFIAIEIPAETKRRLNEFTARLRVHDVRASWVRENSMHLTLRFLGDISAAERAAVSAELSATCEGIAPFEFAAKGCGAFPSPRSPRVLWAGVEGAVDALMELAADVEASVQRAGLPGVRTKYKPHITLGRIRSRTAKTDLAVLLHECAGFDGGAIPVERVSLFASELRPTGAKHTILESFHLGNRG